MTHIYERLHLNCPYVRAREYLRESLEAAAESRAEQTLPLTAPLTFIPGAFQKNVLVRYERGSDPMHFDEPWSVRWTPEGGGPYPDFSGEIAVRADESYRGSFLELQGDYAPPLGLAGQAFDLAVGAKIASSTARALLQRIGSPMEMRYAEEEAAKHESRP